MCGGARLAVLEGGAGEDAAADAREDGGGLEGQHAPAQQVHRPLLR